MGKLVFLDIDGTIRNFDGTIPQSAAEAIAGARENGHEILLCSGRALCQIEQRVIDLGVDGVVSNSGSHVLYRGACIRHEYLPAALYQDMTETMLEKGCLLQLQSFERSAVLKSQTEAFWELWKGIKQVLGPDAKDLVSMPEVVESTSDCLQVEKIIYYSDCFSNEDVRKRWGDQLYVVPLSFPNAVKYGGELSLKSSNKAEAIQAVLEVTGKTTEDVVAVGDSQNDVEMIELAGLGIAMGNATPGAKKAADWVTDDVDKDGLYKAFIKAELL